jgi:hypothetical protein
MASKQAAYVVDAWFNGTLGGGPQCSAAGEFCYLCEFSGDTELKTVIRKMIQERKELPVIVSTCKEIYDTRIRDEVVFRGCTGVEVAKPAWSRNSISCHLVYSTEFPELFESVVTQIHQSLIMKLNSAAIVDGEVVPETVEELRKTVASLAKWQARKR